MHEFHHIIQRTTGNGCGSYSNTINLWKYQKTKKLNSTQNASLFNICLLSDYHLSHVYRVRIRIWCFSHSFQTCLVRIETTPVNSNRWYTMRCDRNHNNAALSKAINMLLKREPFFALNVCQAGWSAFIFLKDFASTCKSRKKKKKTW